MIVEHVTSIPQPVFFYDFISPFIYLIKTQNCLTVQSCHIPWLVH